MARYQADSVANTSIAFTPGVDALDFGSGSASELLFAAAGSDLLVGLGIANIRLLGVSYADLVGSGFIFADDSIFRPGTLAADFLFGAGTDDYLDGGSGDDTLDGGAGNDYLVSGAGKDWLTGGDGQDTLVGGSGFDLLSGDAGNDLYIITTNTAAIDDSSGDDSAVVSASFAKLPSSIEHVSFVGGAQALPYWIDALLPDAAAGLYFQGLLAGAKTMRFAFPAALPGYNTDPADASQFLGFNEAQNAFARQALAYVSTVLDLVFLETTVTDDVNTLAFANNAQPDSVGYAYLPSDSFYGGDVFLDRDTPENLAPTDGSYAALTLIHELGHALGLEHPFAQGTDAPYLVGAEDDTAWTVMSYTDHAAQYQLAYSPLDIAALQYLYGPSLAARIGNDTYLVDPSTASFVWDGGGVDTLSAAGLSQAVTLFLEPGYWGHVGSKTAMITAPGQVTVNFGSHIENLTGGTGSDALSGNALANMLVGDLGNDTLTGAAGDDDLNGGPGFDSLLGGPGNDTLRGGEQADTLLGGDGNDYLNAGKGMDSADGGAGDDTLMGALGNDTLYGFDGFDLLDGGDGDDNLNGGINADVLIGGAGNDFLSGGKGTDSLDGGDGNDTLTGGLGTDRLAGGSGADHFTFRTALDGILNIDTVIDFAAGIDVIELSASVFGAFSSQIGSTVGPGVHLGYDASTGTLSYDADGPGGSSPLAFAIVGAASHPAAMGPDFLIVA